MGLVIGFTGTVEGISDERRQELRRRLALARERDYTQFLHGDCVGADEQAHNIASELGFFVVIHPPKNPKLRAWCEHTTSGVIYPPDEYMVRNQNIVNAADVLVACPKNPDSEELRSGTWATVRRARKRGIPIVFI